MQPKNPYQLKEAGARKRGRNSFPLFSILYWMAVLFYFVTLRYFGLGADAPPGLNYSDLVVYGGSVGLFIGWLFGRFPLHRWQPFRRQRSFGALVLTGTICYSFLFLVIIFGTSLYGNSIEFALSYVFSPGGMIVLLHLFVSSLLYHFILQVDKKFGPGMLLQYSFGKYFTPREEERVFLFLDLKSSTALAETLEHVSYSRMVQDCYAELTVPLLRYKAQVYQYVGDEVVLSWKIDPAFSAAYCYEFFFAFRQRIEARKDYFLRNYGVYPQFKAGLHCGTVTVAQVGEIKTEIAYHGDVLNTASRIQNLCNRFEKELLLSESVLQHLPQKDRSLVSFVADAALRGKEFTTRIFTITNPLRLQCN